MHSPTHYVALSDLYYVKLFMHGPLQLNNNIIKQINKEWVIY